MDNPNNNNQPQPTAPTILEGFCNNPSCKTPFTLAFPPIVIAHHPTVDILTIPHTKGITCPNCGQYHSIALLNYQIMLGIVKDEKPFLNEEPLVQPYSNIVPFTKNPLT